MTTSKTISILGSGWLGLPLAQHLSRRGYFLRASTTSQLRLPSLKAANIDPFIVDIDNITDNIQSFLQSHILIINVPSKNLSAFHNLKSEIEKSEVKNLIFVSSTSVYQNKHLSISDPKDSFLSQSPLLEIEEMFRNCSICKTTIVRFGGLIGYSRNPGNFFSGGKVIKNPDSKVNLIHRDDCIGIITRIIEKEVWGEVFNCCADTHPTKREFYTKAALSIGKKTPICASSSDTSGKVINNEKLKRLLQYEFLHPDLMKIDFT